MSIHLEPIVFILRKGDELKSYGDKYDTACTIIKVNDDTVFVGGDKGFVGNIKMSDLRELKEKLSEYGIKNVTWER